MKNYKESSEFIILDFSRSHNCLLLRSMKNKVRNFNIDIIFRAVSYLAIPSRFEDLSIQQLPPETDLQHQHGITMYKDDRIFQLTSGNGPKHIVMAINFTVYKNQLDILETSIGRYDYSHLGEIIYPPL